MATPIQISDIANYDGQDVTLRGWLYNRTDKGRLQFLLVRDGTGIVQCVAFKKELDAESFELAQALTQAGYPEYMHAFGHHIGRSAHDGATILGPHWERYGTSVDGVIEAGNVFAIELGVQVPERGYIGCEENVLVTPQGAEYLSEPQTEVWCI